MAGPQEVLDWLITAWIGVSILDEESDGGSCCFSFKNAREDLDFIAFFARRGVGVVARLSQKELSIDFFLLEKKSCGASIDDNADGRSMRFSKCSDPKNLTQEIRGHRKAP